MFNFYKILFFLTLNFGILMASSSYSWLSIWMGLEINLLSILPLMTNPNNLYPTEAALKYFISQVIASIFLLFALILIMKSHEMLFFKKNIFMEILFNSAILTKLGAAPFHFWFPEVLEGLNWNMALILMTLQKIAPLIILMYFCTHYYFLLIIIIISTIISGLIGLNQISLRKIMAYSSINHLSWMLSALMFSNLNWALYFIIYLIMTISIIFMFKKFNIYYTKQLYNTCEINKLLPMMIIFMFISLAGLPPFLGFLPKWFVVMSLTLHNQMFLSFILIVFSLVVFGFYSQLILVPMLFNKNEFNYKIEYNFTLPYILQMMSLFALPIFLMIFSI